MDVVIADVVDDDLDGLRTVWHVEHDRLEEIDVLLRQVAIIDHHLEVGVLMLAVGLFQTQLNDARALELLLFREVELRVVSLALFLKQHQLVMGVRNGAVSSVRVFTRSPWVEARPLRVSSIALPWASSCACSFLKRGSSLGR